MFILIVALEIVFIIYNIRKFKNDILSPATISSITFFVATIFAWYCRDVWNISMSSSTVLVIALSLLTMSMAESIGRKIKINVHKYKNDRDIASVNISKAKRMILSIVVVVCTIAYALEAYRIGIMNGGSSLNAFAYMKTAYGVDAGIRMNLIVRQFFKIVLGSAYIACFFLAYNIKKKNAQFVQNIHYYIIVFCGVAITIFSGSRTDIVRIITAFVFDYMVIDINTDGESVRRMNKKKSKKIIKIVLPMVVMVFVLAFISRAIVKINNTATSSIDSILYYVSYYVGSPISVLNTKLADAYNGDFYRLLMGSGNEVSEFIYLGRLNYGGNVGTILCEKVVQQGLLILVLYILMVYLVGTIIYRKSKLKENIGYYNSILTICASSWYYVFTMSYYSDILNSFGFIVTNLLTNLVIWVVYAFLFKVKVRATYKIKK